MADNVAITAGSGTSIATDDVSGVHYQKFKLIDGTADSSTAIPGDGTNGLDVDVTRVQGTVTVAPFPGRTALKSGTASATATTSTSVIAGTASNYLYISTIAVHNSSTTDTYVTLQDGSGGTSLLVLPAAAKGGAIVTFPTPLLVPTQGNGLFFAAGAGVTTMYVSAAGYIATT